MDHDQLTSRLDTLHAHLARLDQLDRAQRRERQMRAELLWLRAELRQIPKPLIAPVLTSFSERLDQLLEAAPTPAPRKWLIQNQFESNKLREESDTCEY